MTRRGILRALFASPLAFAAGLLPTSAPGSYGYLDVAEAARRKYLPARVTVDGADVSNDCYACDDTRGIAWLFKTNADGHKFYDRERDDIAREIRHGHVVFTPRGHA